MDPHYLLTTVENKLYLTPTVLLVKLHLGSKQKILFGAGQYVVVKVPVGNEIADRPFSIASSPVNTGFIELLIKIIPHGVASSFFQHIKKGEQVTLSQPRGAFSFESDTDPATFVASSTGVAPLRSMLHDLLKNKKVSQTLHLVFCVPTAEESFLIEELSELSARYKNFTFTVDTDLTSYSGKLHIPSDHTVYLCGGPNFIKDSLVFLGHSGVSEDRIRYEKFE